MLYPQGMIGCLWHASVLERGWTLYVYSREHIHI